MPAYNFQQRFAGLVEQRVKRGTIRAKRKARPRVGQMAYCFTGMRTKQCRRLGAWRIDRVEDVKILREGVLLNGGALRAEDLDRFARMDGFLDWIHMRDWFEFMHGLPFSGDWVLWDCSVPVLKSLCGSGIRALFGVTPRLPLFGFPEGRARISQGPRQFTTVSVRCRDGRVRRWFVEARNGAWWPSLRDGRVRG